jgi:ABC-type antimicrobial peptide transport system permease subunit
MPMMQTIRSLWYDRWINAAVMLGVLCTTAVLTGALLVGDSMRGSLKALTLDRLGNVDTILIAPAFISPLENPEVPLRSTSGSLSDLWTKIESVIYLPGSVEYEGKVSGIQILGLPTPHSPLPTIHSPLANQALADRLNIKPGEKISLRFNSPQSIPPESSLGRHDQLIRTQITVNEVIPNHGIGRFSLKADQQAEPLMIVPLNWLQQKLGVGEKINAVFFMTDLPQQVSTAEQRKELENWFKPSLDDLGIVTETKNERFTQYIKSARMLFTKPQAEAIQNVLPEAKPGLLYLATSIKATKNGKETPYSTVYAYNKEPEVERSETSGLHRLFDITLNCWTADDLDVEVGDEIELTWFDPDNVNVTKSQKFTLTEILPMDGLGADPNLVPEVKGFTDEVSIADWDPPFPFDAKKIRKKDEDYWDKYHAAPKAFVPLAVGQELFASRFGQTSTFVIENGKWKMENWGENLTASNFGIRFLPVKEQGLIASAGTTPFSVLFLSFSFFIIASALMLVLMLFRLSVEMKAKQIGIRLAVGWTPRQVAQTLLAEGMVIAVCGAFFGMLFGIFYARLMVHGLTTWWVEAVTVPFLTLYVNPASLVIGFVSGIMLAAWTIILSLRKISRVPIRSLLGGIFKTAAPTVREGFNRSHRSLPLPAAVQFHSLASFAVSNTARYRGRSWLCIGLVASTTFLVLSVGIFRLDPKDQGNSNTVLIAETAFPVYEDIGTPEGRANLSIQTEDEKFIEAQSLAVVSCRIKDGDSTSCLNLYQTGNPRVLGIPKFMVGLDAFFNIERENKFSPLLQPITIDSDGVRRVPVVLDANTAMYALHLYGGIGEVYELDDGLGGKIRCEIAGLLHNSILQGEIIMSEENLLQLFPDVAGYRYFLFKNSIGTNLDDRTLKIFYDLLGDYGFQGETAADRLRKLFAIQNTYLSTFQSLGGIGLLLGIFGLAVIQSRNVFERRKEIALFQAIGFSKSRVILMLLYESFSLLLRGLGLALIASLFAVLPFLLGFASQSASPLSIAVQFAWLLGSMLFVGIVSNVAASLAVLKIPVARELAEER